MYKVKIKRNNEELELIYNDFHILLSILRAYDNAEEIIIENHGQAN